MLGDSTASQRNAEGLPGIQRQAKAAINQSDSVVASERARLFIVPSGVTRNGDKDRNPTFPYTILNLGRTSALISGVLTECEVTADVTMIPAYDEARFSPAMLALIGGATINSQPGHECTLTRSLSDNEFSTLSDKTEVILFKGYIKYQDVFGRKWKKRFGLYGGGDGKFYGLVNRDAYNFEDEEK